MFVSFHYISFALGNIPPMVRLLQAYIKKAPAMVSEKNKLVRSPVDLYSPMFTLYRELFSFKSSSSFVII